MNLSTCLSTCVSNITFIVKQSASLTASSSPLLSIVLTGLPGPSPLGRACAPLSPQSAQARASRDYTASVQDRYRIHRRLGPSRPTTCHLSGQARKGLALSASNARSQESDHEARFECLNWIDFDPISIRTEARPQGLPGPLGRACASQSPQSVHARASRDCTASVQARASLSNAISTPWSALRWSGLPNCTGPPVAISPLSRASPPPSSPASLLHGGRCE